jgi:hypothetical protein
MKEDDVVREIKNRLTGKYLNSSLHADVFGCHFKGGRCAIDIALESVQDFITQEKLDSLPMGSDEKALKQIEQFASLNLLESIK